MPALEQFSSLVASLYEAAANPQRWEHFVDSFYIAMQASRGVMTAVASQSDLGKVVLRGYTESEMRDYSDYYWQHDLVLSAGPEKMATSTQWSGRVEEIISYRTLEASEIYNDYYRNLDMHHASCLMIGETGPYSTLGLAAWRPAAVGSFNAEELHLVELLAPHRKQAFLLHAKLTALHVKSMAIESALDVTGSAVIALHSDGRLLSASSPAERLLHKGVLTLKAGRLHIPNASGDQKLQHLIDGALCTAQMNVKKQGSTLPRANSAMLLALGSEASPLQLQVLPLRLDLGMSDYMPAVLVFIADPHAVVPDRMSVLQELYSLSPIEARLADLFLQGQELKQAGDALKLTYVNTRFHMKQIFRKTNTKRQTELMRLLLAIPTQ